MLRVGENDIQYNQTESINWHIISENWKILGVTVKVADNEDNIVATVIALYAQKVIDSINHQYIITLLNRIRPHNFESIFKLSHKAGMIESVSKFLLNETISNGA